MPLKQLRSYHGGRWRTCVSWLSHTSANTTFLSKGTDYFSHMLLQSWEAKLPERKFASTGDQTHNHQVMSLTHSPLSNPSGVVIQTFIDQIEESFENKVGKGENAGNHHFLLFPVFSTQSKKEIFILAMFYLLSANAFNLITSKILLFGKGLTLSQTTNFRPFQAQRVCSQQF